MATPCDSTLMGLIFVRFTIYVTQPGTEVAKYSKAARSSEVTTVEQVV